MKKVTAIFLAALLCLIPMTSVFAEELPENAVQSEEATNAITAQPEGMSVKAGETATFSVQANGKVRSYQWQVSKDGGKKWKKLDAKEATLSVEAKPEYDGYLYRCAVTLKNYKVACTNAAKLTVAVYPEQTFDAADDFAVAAPEGAFPEGTTMDTVAPDFEEVKEALNNVGTFEGEVLYAADITFSDKDGEEIQPDKAVTVSFAVEPGLNADRLALYHINADADGLTKRGLAAEEVSFTYDAETGLVTFEGEHFSTYTLVWKEGENTLNATIHWGTLSDVTSGEFTEFDATAIDASAAVGSASLRAIYPGYEYVDAAYYASAPESISVDHSSSATGRIFINDTITRVPAAEGSDYTWTAEDSTSAEDFTIEAGSHIYVIYRVPETPQTNPSGGNDPTVPSPTTEKKVSDNKDGTYTITLEVTGAQITQQIQTGANVIIVYDISQSMSENISGSGSSAVTRLEASRQATHKLIDTLNPDTNDVDLALVTFEVDAQIRQFSGNNWTKSGTAVTNVIDGITNVSQNLGTNWHQALQYAYQLASNAPDDDDTYIIFITDGCPSRNSFTYDNNGHNGGAGTTNTSDPCYTGALAYAKGIAGTVGTSYSTDIYYNNRYRETITVTGLGDYLYGVYTGNDNTSMLQTLINASGGKQTIIATTPQAIADAFENIATTITNNLRPANVTVDDGIPELSSVSANVSGEAGGFIYSKKAKGADDSTYTAWSEAPAASYTAENGVVWDLSSAPGGVDANTTYRLQFTVWPSQDAYDMLADLNNGVKALPLSDAEMEQLVVKIGESERYVYTPGETEGSGTWTGGLTTAQLLAAIAAAEEAETAVTYSIPTNTHLNTTYTFGGTTYSDSPAAGALPSEDMLLDDTSIKVKKIWNNLVDERGASILYQTDESGNYVLDGNGNKIPVTDSNGEIVYYANLIVTRDGAEYLNPVVVRSDKNWISDDIFISCGVLTTTTTNGTTTVSIKEIGHEYKVIEPADYSYYWNLTSDTYRPMVINGTTALLILETDETVLSGLSGDYVSNANGTWYKIEGKYYRTHTSSTDTLTATNDRRSSLDLKKVVSGFAPEGTEFRFDIDITFPADVVDKEVWFSVRDGEETIYRLNTNATPETRTVTGFTYNAEDRTYTYTYDGKSYTAPAADDGTGGVTLTGYYYYTLTAQENGTSTGSFYLNLEDGWNARFTNIPEDTAFEITEAAKTGYNVTGITGIYEFVKTQETHDCTTGDQKEMTVESPKISGTLGLSNGIYYIEYTNAAEFFFVYHSSDNTIERISMDDTRIVDGKFIIVNEVKTGYLYGGYYSAYTKAGMTDDQIFSATYSENGTSSGGVYADKKTTGYWTTDTGNGVAPYTGATVSFKNAKAYTVAGNAMIPAAGTVYYLKEVPDQYFRPATYVIYDTRSANLDLKKMYMLSVTDDSLYQMVGIDGTIELGTTTKLYSTFKVTNDTGATETIKVSNINSSLSRGFLTVWDACDKIKAGSYTMTPYFVTKDGIKVTSAVTRTLTISDKLSYTETDFKSNDAKVASTYSVYTAPTSGDGE